MQKSIAQHIIWTPMSTGSEPILASHSGHNHHRIMIRFHKTTAAVIHVCDIVYIFQFSCSFCYCLHGEITECQTENSLLPEGQLIRADNRACRKLVKRLTGLQPRVMIGNIFANHCCSTSLQFSGLV